MKYRSILLSTKWFFLLFAVFLYGCASQQLVLENHKNEYMARPLTELKRALNKPGSYPSTIGWKETTYPLANGNYVYVEPLSKDCSLHWEINPEDTIVGAETKGSGCGEYKDSDSGVGLSKVKTME